MRYDGLADGSRKERFSFSVVVAVSVIAFLWISWREFMAPLLVSNLFYIEFALVCSLILVPLVFWRFRLRKLIVFIGFAVLIYMSWIGDTRKTFLKDFDQIKPGMTTAQVEAKMKPYSDYAYPPHKTGAPDASERVYRWTDNADWGMVTFKNGRVVLSHFSPD